jgi:SAM-dependent methyltransferase
VKTPSYLERLAQCGIAGAHPGGLRLTSKLLSMENPGADTVVLDVGCGAGETAAYLGVHYPCKVVAIDINPLMLAKAQSKFAQHQLDIQLLQANASDLPFPKATFDLVLSESVTIFTKIAPTLSEYYRVLKPGGRLIAIEITATEELSPAELAEIEPAMEVKHLPTQELWEQMFRDAGFTTVGVLTQSKFNRAALFTPVMNRFFTDFRRIMLRYHAKLHYAVYRCQK